MYKLYANPETNQVIGVIRLADNTWIPMVEANTDYQQYLAWCAEGNPPEPAEEQQ